ncbi:MAG: FIVAR domain-containing protein, partial [Ruminococcus sp.]|nr:FIVAR domain-containing protein [Ruminococcus sp.]
GTYTITASVADMGDTADGVVVFVVDLAGAATNYPNLTAVLDSITVDGESVAIDSSKVLYGNIEGNGNYRIEIYNEYGSGTASSSPIDTGDIYAESTLAVTFTVSGTGVEDTEATEEPTEDSSEAASDIAITATLGYADADWSAQDWSSSVTVTGDGTYTITASVADMGDTADGVVVFVIDLAGASTAYPDLTAVLDSITVDGDSVAIDGTKVLYGDIEGNGNYRIEIYNQYGSGTASNSPIDPDDIYAEETLSITFTVSGLGAATTEEPTEEPTEDSSEATEDSSAEEEVEVNAALCFTTSGWYPTTMDGTVGVVVNGDGTYTITWDVTEYGGINDALVFCIDLYDASVNYPDLIATLESITVDGEEVAFDASKIIYGDIEENGNYRIEIYNTYGDSAADPGVDPDDIYAEETLSITFSVSGLSTEATEESSTEDSSEEPTEDSSEDPTTEAGADKTALEAALATAGTIDTSLYTEESVAAYEEALAAAEAVYNDADATQDDVDAATAALENAIAGLVEVSSTTEEPTDETDETEATTTTADEEETTTTAADEEETTASDDDDTTTTAAADDSSSSSSSSSTSSDSTPNTGAQAAVGLSIFMAAGLAGVVAIKKRRK